MIDPFKADGFSTLSLTAAINTLPYRPMQVAEMGLFQEAGIATVDTAIEFDGNTIGLVSVQPRNASGQPVTNDKRKLVSLRVPHMPQRATILADEVQGVRAFGSESNVQALQSVINQRLAKMRQQIDYTVEAHRIAAIKGSYYDANGVATSLFTTFGVSQQTVQMKLDTASTEVQGTALDILTQIETELAGTFYTGAVALCGSSFWKKFITHPKVKETYLNTAMAASLRQDPREAVDINGITFMRYRGTASCAIDSTLAYVIPMGVPDLFLTRFAPAPYVETVNTLGLPYYAKSEPMEFGKGVQLESQSNALNICTRPNAVIKLVENT